jgi:alpha-tubulin suppressor-like RCC1 family protein
MINDRHNQLPAMMILSNAEEEDAELNWNYDDSFQLIDRIEIDVQDGSTYLFFVTLNDEEAIGNSSTFRLVGTAETASTPVAALSHTTLPSVPEQRSLPITRVRAGRYNSFVITDRGRLFAAGLSDQGQLGQGSVSRISPFTSVMVYTADVATGSVHTLFLGEDGRLWVSGRNEEGQLGDGTTQRRTTPFVLTSSVKSMDGGFGHTLLVKRDGTAWAVGANTHGQLGTGDTNPRSTLTQIFTEVESVHTNWNQTSFLITVDGDLYGWGNNAEGQLGLGHTRPVLQPTYIRENVADVAAGVSFTWILFDDGTLYSTGNNSQGQLGLAGQKSRTTLGEVARGVTKIAAGDFFAFYIDDKAQLWATGSNQYGQWGIGSTANTSAATGPVMVLTDVQQIAAGASHAIALKRDGTLWTTGLNTSGQLGDDTEGFRLQWRQIRGIVD